MENGYDGDQVEESSSDNEPGPSSRVSLPAPTSMREVPRWASSADPSSSFQQSTMFTLPHRSIFSSGLPTSSISVSTAQALMSSPSSLHPLSTLSSTNINGARRAAREASRAIVLRKTRSARIQKLTDDPSSSIEDGSFMRRPAIRPTSMAVSTLFSATDLNASRTTSFAGSSTTSRHARSTLNNFQTMTG